MKLRLIAILCVLALTACESRSPDASADEPADESSKSESAEKSDESNDKEAPEKDRGAAAESDKDLRDKNCEEFYAYSREVCMKSLEDGLDVSCYKVLTKAGSTRKIMAGEGSMAERTKNLSEEQKVRTFCGRFYEDLAEKVAEADTENVDHPAKCQKAIAVIDEKCLKPMAAGKAYASGCGTGLQTVSKWKMGEKFCQLSIDMITR
jgi:hypothetical protein